MSTTRHHPDAEVIIETELPPLPTEGKARLRKMIAFLRELPAEKFAFETVVDSVDVFGCGTVCCVVGWTPKLFPDIAQWHHFTVVAKGAEGECWDHIGSAVFGMSREIAYDLFSPDDQRKVHRSLPNCGSLATPTRVADMLESYIALTETPKRP